MARPKTAPPITTMRCSKDQYDRIAQLKKGMPQWAFMNQLFEGYQSVEVDGDRPKVRELVLVDKEDRSVKIPKKTLDCIQKFFPGWRHHQIIAVLLMPYDERSEAA